MSEPTDPIAQIARAFVDDWCWNKDGAVLFNGEYRERRQAVYQLVADALRAQRTEGRQQSNPEPAPDPPWTLFMDLKLTGNHGGLIRDHHASRPVTDGTGFHALYQRWLEITEAPIERTEGRPPAISELVTCSLRDPDQVCHLPRLDCQHEAPHLIAACGAFTQERTEGRPQVETPHINMDDVPIGPGSGYDDWERRPPSMPVSHAVKQNEKVADLQSQIETLKLALANHAIQCPQCHQAAQLAAGGRSEGRATWQQLAEYCEHKWNCAVDRWQQIGVMYKPRPACTCGLDALLPSTSGEDQ